MNRKVVYSMLLIAVLLAAVVGGTYAVFYETASTHVQFVAGAIDFTVDWDVLDDGPAPIFINPDDFTDWKPGDSVTIPIKIKNKANKAWIQVYVYKTKAWDVGAPEFWDVATVDLNTTWPGVWNQWVLDTDQEMVLDMTVEFPQFAGPEFELAQGDLAILIVAKQYRHKLDEGYSCVALEDKDDDYYPILGNDVEGLVCYKAVGSDLLVDVNASGLAADSYFQLTLEGTGAGTTVAPYNFEDASFASMSGGDLYVAGWSDFSGSYLLPAPSTDPTKTWWEGAYNFAGVGAAHGSDEVMSDGLGNISYGATISGLPLGTYDQVKFIVKLVGGAPPLPGDSWTPVLMEMDYLSFNLPTP